MTRFGWILIVATMAGLSTGCHLDVNMRGQGYAPPVYYFEQPCPPTVVHGQHHAPHARPTPRPSASPSPQQPTPAPTIELTPPAPEKPPTAEPEPVEGIPGDITVPDLDPAAPAKKTGRIREQRQPKTRICAQGQL